MAAALLDSALAPGREACDVEGTGAAALAWVISDVVEVLPVVIARLGRAVLWDVRAGGLLLRASAEGAVGTRDAPNEMADADAGTGAGARAAGSTEAAASEAFVSGGQDGGSGWGGGVDGKGTERSILSTR